MKRIALCLLLVSAICLCLPAPSSAQASLGARTTISLRGTPPALLFSVIAKANLGLEATVDPVLTRLTTITLEDVTVRMLLDASCDSIGCRWRIEGRHLVVEALPPDPARGRSWILPPGDVMPPGSKFVNTPVSAVFEAIGRAVGEGGSYVVDEVNASQPVTVDVSGQDALRAIAMVVRAAGLRPGSPYTVTIYRPGQKPTIIKTGLPKEPDAEEIR